MVAYAFARRYPETSRGVMMLDIPLPGLGSWDEVKASPITWHMNFQETPDLPEQLLDGAKPEPASIRPFKMHVPDQVLIDLRHRLSETNWPDQLPGTTWEYGVDIKKVRELADYWQNGYDWRAQEAKINRFDQFTTDIDGQRIYFIHQRSLRPGAISLLMIHGWPGANLEFEQLIGPLTDPRDKNSAAFDVVIPSLPGFGCSGPTTTRGWGPQRMAKALVVLTDRLGYSKYGIQGGDWGSAVAQDMAHQEPTHCRPIRRNNNGHPVSGLRRKSLCGFWSSGCGRVVEWRERRSCLGPTTIRAATGYSAMTPEWLLHFSPLVEKMYEILKQENHSINKSFECTAMLSLALVSGLTGLAATNSALYAEQTIPGISGGPVIQIEDVDRFYVVYDDAGGHPSAERLQHDYLDLGSDGLHTFAKIRNITGASIALTLVKTPDIYSNARRCAAVLPQVRERLKVDMHKLSVLYANTKFLPVTIAVGRGRPVAAGGPTDGVMVGLEALCGVKYFDADLEDRFVHVIAHEYIHAQQAKSLANNEQPTVLEVSLLEGAAEFLGEKISGGVGNPGVWAEIKGHEAEIEAAFVPDEDKTDLSKWVFNGTLDKPGDLGYWVGYRIVKSYYQRAADKRQAISDILEMTDPKEFLSKSGWHPGIELR
jgi:pimeloyl-ACP methyl ester carboxylesterase/uncharacterized protein YjaZ